MANTYTSPFATAFNNAVKRGTSWTTAVNNIASRNNKTPEFVWNSLYKAGICCRQKFNGQWIYFPWNAKKCNATTCKGMQYNCWQAFVEWCICSGYCTPEQAWKHCGSQKEFMTWCRKFFAKQFNGTTTTKKSSSRRSTTRKSTTSARRSSYSFPSKKRRSTTSKRSYRRAA